MRTEPENPTVRLGRSKPAHYLCEIEHHEHAALIEAIKRNFPEIYENPAHSNFGPETDADSTANPAIEPSAAA